MQKLFRVFERRKSVVPDWQDWMRSEGQETHLGIGYLLSGWKGLFDQAAGDAKAGLGFGSADEIHRSGEVGQGLAGPVFADWSEEAVFNRIPLGSAGRVVADRDRKAERDDQLSLQFAFPGAHACPVAAAAVGQDEEFIGVGVLLAAKVAPPGGHVVRGEGRRVMRDADKD